MRSEEDRALDLAFDNRRVGESYADLDDDPERLREVLKRVVERLAGMIRTAKIRDGQTVDEFDAYIRKLKSMRGAAERKLGESKPADRGRIWATEGRMRRLERAIEAHRKALLDSDVYPEEHDLALWAALEGGIVE